MDAPPIIRAKPRPRAWMAGLGLLGGVAVGWVWRFEPGVAGFYPQCVVHLWTGLQCPGCGSLRAVHAALHGRFLESLRDNALLWVSAAFILCWLGMEWKAGRPPLQARLGRKRLVICLVAIALFTIARNLPFAPFNLLSPAP